MSTLRRIPGIEQLRQRETIRTIETRYGRAAVVVALRQETAALRATLTENPGAVRDADDAARQIERGLETRLARAFAPSLRPVINGTGVIVHTNLGRAPLALPGIERIAAIAAGYSNLEYDIGAGLRGSRTTHASTLLTRLTGAEAAAVVNNNAAAMLLTLAALATGREVIISRGELVEIGGGFRIPDVLRQSGARLREVGTTNRTRPADYAAAITDRTALILRVHPSNFRIEGFTERPALADVVAIGERYGIPVVEDLGSGNLFDGPEGPDAPPLREPTVRESVDAGVAVCCFSGDKLLGGPQSGIIVGTASAVDQVRTHPLMRALRVDKLTLAALEATLIEHAAGRATDTVPVARMIAVTPAELDARAQAIVKQLAGTPGLTVTPQESEAAIGGGSTPGVTIPSVAVRVEVQASSASRIDAALRACAHPIVGRIVDDRLLLDLRTVRPEEDALVVEALSALAPPSAA